tara:strand:- start:7668 stop:8156 length:489 start_codon:yes stop_codon:yes gene_type:complete
MIFLSLNKKDNKILDKLCENFQVLLRYSSPSCIHCSNMFEEWLKLKDHSELKHFNNLAIVDANTEIVKNQKHLSAKKHILNNEMVPSIFFINRKKVKEFEGERKTENFIEFIKNNIQKNKKGKKKTFKNKKKLKGGKKESSKCKTCCKYDNLLKLYKPLLIK